MAIIPFELRDAARGLRRDRGFVAAVILTLGVTIGATTAAFSIVNGVLLKPLAFPEPDQLVTLKETWREVAASARGFGTNQRHFEYWRAHNQSFASMAEYVVLPANLSAGGAAEQISVLRSSGTLFDVLNVRPLIGRALVADDDHDGAANVVVISERLWRQLFGARAGVPGETMVLDGLPYTIVGVLPSAFRLPSGNQLLSSVDAAIAMHVDVGWSGDHNNSALGRLRPGVPIAAARAEMEVLQKQVSVIATRESGQQATLGSIVSPLSESIVERSRQSLVTLFASVVVVLLIACANLTNLALTRTLSRLRDAAIRAALGATRPRLLRQALLEHTILGVTGGVLGLAIASVALRVFVQTAPIDIPRTEDIAIDGLVLAFAMLVTLATVLIVAALPVWHLASRGPQFALRGGAHASAEGPAAVNARASLTSLQIALSVTLLTVTMLLGASLWRVLSVDYGFNAEHVLSVPLAMPAARYAEARPREAVYDRLLDDVRAIPGVRSASTTSLAPMRGEGQVNSLLAAGTNVPRDQQPSANFRFVGPEYFMTLQLPVTRGRVFTLGDRSALALMPAVISESVAARLWPGQDALGREFGRGIEGEANFQVIGITPDARTTSLERTPPLMVYLPYWWRSRAALTLLVRSDLDPEALIGAIRHAIDRIDPEIAIGDVRPLDDMVDATLAGRRYQARLFIVFGVVALAIATLGVYAVAAYSVSKRRRELNIRVALGAAHHEVITLLMRQTARTVAIGAAAGLAGALAAGRFTAGMLYEVQPRDPMIISSVVLIVAIVALAASMLAIRAGLAINPVAALREE